MSTTMDTNVDQAVSYLLAMENAMDLNKIDTIIIIVNIVQLLFDKNIGNLLFFYYKIIKLNGYKTFESNILNIINNYVPFGCKTCHTNHPETNLFKICYQNILKEINVNNDIINVIVLYLNVNNDCQTCAATMNEFYIDLDICGYCFNNLCVNCIGLAYLVPRTPLDGSKEEYVWQCQECMEFESEQNWKLMQNEAEELLNDCSYDEQEESDYWTRESEEYDYYFNEEEFGGNIHDPFVMN